MNELWNHGNANEARIQGPGTPKRALGTHLDREQEGNGITALSAERESGWSRTRGGIGQRRSAWS